MNQWFELALRWLPSDISPGSGGGRPTNNHKPKGGLEMTKFMWSGRYTQAGTKGLIAEGGTARRAAIDKLLQSVGGKIEAFYYAFGSDDVIMIGEVPDNVTGASISMTVAASGAVNGKVTILLTPEEIDRAAKMSPVYKPPGT